MRAVVIDEYGGPDVLRVQDRPAPELGPSDVRIAVQAAGVNFADVMTRLGQYPHAQAPCVPGFEVSGVAIEVGPAVTRIAAGDRVAAATRLDGYAEEVCIDEDDVLALPDTISAEQGASVPITYATGYALLIGYGALRPGDRVLIQAAAGGVGWAATQLAKHVGATVVGTASAAKHEAIRANGVDVALAYNELDHEHGPFDIALDAIGGDSFKRSYDLLRPGGRLAPFGAVSVFAKPERQAPGGDDQGDFRLLGGLDAASLLVDSKGIIGMDLRVLWEDRGSLREWLQPLEPLLSAGVIRPKVSAAVPFDEAPAAHRLLSERQNVGKVVLVP